MGHRSSLATRTIIWTQCALGALTAVLCMLFARLAFASSFVGFLAGLLVALHPFWIVNVAELQDGVLDLFPAGGVSFPGTSRTSAAARWPACCLAVRWRAALVRAALLPFSFVGFPVVLAALRQAAGAAGSVPC